MAVLKWVVFNTSEEFEKWQHDNPQFTMVSVQPVYRGYHLTAEEEQINEYFKTGKGDALNNIAVIVFYRLTEYRGPETR